MIYSLYKSLTTSLLSIYTTTHMLETVSLVSVQITLATIATGHCSGTNGDVLQEVFFNTYTYTI